MAPKNLDVLNQIATIYGAQAGREGDNYRNVLAVYGENVTTPPGLDTELAARPGADLGPVQPGPADAAERPRTRR